jgi:glutaredoxin
MISSGHRMSRVCPNCRYVRQPTDSAPDWQCPACEMAYNKGAGAVMTESYGRYVAAPAKKPAPGSVGKWLLIVFAVALGVWAGKPIWQASAGIEARQAARPGEQPSVILYATEWCGYCAATRKFFAAKGIRYTELDVEKSAAARDQHRRLGGNGVPLIVVGEELVHGYDEARLRSLLKPWLTGA